MDGFDVQAMGYVAPAIVQDWQIDKAQLGPVFGAGLLGVLIGSLLFSMAADRIGRRPVLVSIFSRRETRWTCFCSHPCAVSSRGSKERVRRLPSVTTSASPVDTDALAAHYEHEDFWLRSLQEGKEDGPEIVSDAKETFSRGWALIAEF
jgi:hypothetical protein